MLLVEGPSVPLHVGELVVLLAPPEAVARADIADNVVLAAVVVNDGQRLCAATSLEGAEVRDVNRARCLPPSSDFVCDLMLRYRQGPPSPIPARMVRMRILNDRNT